MKNRETLIQILLILRSNGIINKKILLAVEKLPPHYYLNLLGLYKNFKQINVNELIRLLKILQNVLDHKPKLDNVFITDIKKGWLVVLASFLGKRIYGLCPNREIKEKNPGMSPVDVAEAAAKPQTSFAPSRLKLLFSGFLVKIEY